MTTKILIPFPRTSPLSGFGADKSVAGLFVGPESAIDIATSNLRRQVEMATERIGPSVTRIWNPITIRLKVSLVLVGLMRDCRNFQTANSYPRCDYLAALPLQKV